MKKSELEDTFENNFEARFKRAGFSFETQIVIPGARFIYDVRLVKGDLRILIEIDGHGFGHSSVKGKARDAEKGNHAVLTGYLFFRITTKHFRRAKGVVIPGAYAHELVDAVLKIRGAKKA